MAHLLENLGGLAIALIAAGCTGVAHVQQTTGGTIALLACAAVMLPFVAAACAILSLGVLCCSPILIVSAACAWLPPLLAHVTKKLKALWEFLVEFRHSERVRLLWASACDLVYKQPLLVAGAGTGLLMLSPLLVVVFVVAVFWYVILAPVTVPLTLWLCWRCISPAAKSGEEWDYGDEPSKRSSATLPPTQTTSQRDANNFEATSPPPSVVAPSEETTGVQG